MLQEEDEDQDVVDVHYSSSEDTWMGDYMDGLPDDKDSASGETIATGSQNVATLQLPKDDGTVEAHMSAEVVCCVVCCSKPPTFVRHRKNARL